MSAGELSEHLGYWNDPVKLTAYRDAINEVVGPGDHVIDLGTGTGLLGMLAVRAGADRVYAYDAGDVLGLARDLAVANGLESRMEFIKAYTTDAPLPQADVIVCDQIGGLVYDAGILEFFADATRRGLRPGGRLVPASFELFLAPVESEPGFRQVEGWHDENAEFDLAAARQLAANTQFNLDADDVRMLSPGEQFASVPSSDDGPIRGECSWTVSTTGTFHGLVGWFRATMSPSVTLTNDPTDDGRMNRWINFYPAHSAHEVQSGDRLSATIDIRPASRTVTWTVSREGHPPERHSTFEGSFMFDDPFGAGIHRNADPARAEVAAELVAMAADGASTTELIDAAKRHGDRFVTPEAATKFARRLSELLATSV